MGETALTVLNERERRGLRGAAAGRGLGRWRLAASACEEVSAIENVQKAVKKRVAAMAVLYLRPSSADFNYCSFGYREVNWPDQPHGLTTHQGRLTELRSKATSN